MTPVRIALIGAGQIGRRHLDVILPDPDYAAAGIADPAAEDFARQRGLAYFSDAEAMLDEVRPDGAIVASPNQFHVAGAMACIARKVPVLIEKPLADSLAGALDLVAAAKAAGVPVLVGHHRRHNPIMRKAAEVIRDGWLGQVAAVSCTWLSHKHDAYFDIAWRRQPGGGTALINGIHEIDCLRMLCGEIESIQAFVGHGVREFPVEDTAAAVIRFESGTLGTIIISDTVSTPWSREWTSHENPNYPHESQNSILVAGTKGSLAVPSLEYWWHEPGQGWFDPLTRRRIPIRPADAYVGQMRNLAQVIRGLEDPVVSGEQGLRTLAATLAIAESATAGRPIRIDEMLARRKSWGRSEEPIRS